MAPASGAAAGLGDQTDATGATSLKRYLLAVTSLWLIIPVVCGLQNLPIVERERPAAAGMYAPVVSSVGTAVCVSAYFWATSRELGTKLHRADRWAARLLFCMLWASRPRALAWPGIAAALYSAVRIAESGRAGRR